MKESNGIPVIRYAVSPSKNTRGWLIVAIVEIDGVEQTGLVRCHATTKKQAHMYKDQFNIELGAQYKPAS
jgi:hypothetical protein